MKRFRQNLFPALCVLICAAAVAVAALSACGGANQKSPSSSSSSGDAPLDTLKSYNEAIKKGEADKMKALLSKASLKMAEDEARAQNVSIDEILRRQKLYTPGQTTVKYRNQKIQGERASIEIENSFGAWEVIPFVRENGKWKIANEFYEEELMRQAEEDSRRLDEQSNRTKQP